MRNLFVLIVFPICIQLTACKNEKELKLLISADTSLYHKPLDIMVQGLAPGQQAEIQLIAIDAEQNKWESSAKYIASSDGQINLLTDSSIEGSFTGVHPMGLFWSMKSEDDHQIATGKGYSATLSLVIDNKIIESKSIYRRSTRELETLGIKKIELRDIFIADLYLPSGEGKFPTIVFLGGSGGSFRQERASLLASEGFAVLNLKYFKHEGLPEGIIEIPLEYLSEAYKWLKQQSFIDSTKIGIMGRSMGTQLALLYAAHYDGIRYVVAEAPSSVVWFGWEDGKSSFTYKGIGFPYAEYTDEDSERLEKEMSDQGLQYRDGPKFLSAFKNKKMIRNAAIPVENIKCPILLISGKDDLTWPSSMMSEMMIKRLDENNFQFDYKHYSYENAGHNFAGGGQGCGIPYLPPEDYSNGSARGGTVEGNAKAAIKSFEDILRFIEEHQANY